MGNIGKGIFLGMMKYVTKLYLEDDSGIILFEIEEILSVNEYCSADGGTVPELWAPPICRQHYYCTLTPLAILPQFRTNSLLCCPPRSFISPRSITNISFFLLFHFSQFSFEIPTIIVTVLYTIL